MEHGLSSVNMLLRKGALDHFDTVFCAGDHVIDEIRAMERVYNLPEKNLIKYGYGMLDDITRQYLEYKEKNPDAVEEKQETFNRALASFDYEESDDIEESLKFIKSKSSTQSIVYHCNTSVCGVHHTYNVNIAWNTELFILIKQL